MLSYGVTVTDMGASSAFVRRSAQAEGSLPAAKLYPTLRTVAMTLS